MPLGTILQVEDEPADAVLLQSVFASEGIQHPLQLVTDGQQAIGYLQGAGMYSDRTRYPLPCLILLDLKLPRISGLDVLRWIRERPTVCRTVVVVFSSSALPSDVQAAYDAGANSFLEKPVAYEDWQRMTRFLKGWWLDLNQFAAV
jgi:CheY-like chemotaxis protein